MKKSLPQLILEHLFGRKYYFVVLKDLTGTKLPHYHVISSYVFLSRQDAQTYLDTNVRNASRSAEGVAIHSFRSKAPMISHYNPNRHLDYSQFEKQGI